MLYIWNDVTWCVNYSQIKKFLKNAFKNEKKIHSSKSSSTAPEKYWEVVKLIVFPDSAFCLMYKFYHWQRIQQSCLPGSGRSTLLIFEKTSATWLSLNSHSSSLIFSKMAFLKKSEALGHKSHDCTSIFPQDDHHILGCNVFYENLLICHTHHEKDMKST